MNFEMEERNRIMGLLFGAYGKANDANRQAIYVTALADFPNELLSKTVKKLMLENNFLPSISEIAAAAESLYHTVDDSGRIKDWDEAWYEISRAMQNTPWGKHPEFSRPEIGEAVACIGWYELQRCLEKDLNIMRAQVRNAYEVICKRKRQQACNRYVLGVNTDGLLGTSKKTGAVSIGSVVQRISGKAGAV